MSVQEASGDQVQQTAPFGDGQHAQSGTAENVEQIREILFGPQNTVVCVALHKGRGAPFAGDRRVEGGSPLASGCTEADIDVLVFAPVPLIDTDIWGYPGDTLDATGQAQSTEILR